MEPIFHPMKGPMATQSLRGMANHGPMHWRGDRTGGNDAPSAQPDSGTFDERAAFDQFNGAFPDLLGRHTPIPQADMDAFTDFILRVTYPPNPNRPLDNVLTADQEAGRRLFDTVNCGIPSAPEFNGAVLTCASCHAIDPNANPGTAAPGFFGTSGLSSFDFNPQLFKAPHLRNAYQKIGMFGNPENPGFLGGDNGFKGDQVRGFGFLNDGERRYGVPLRPWGQLLGVSSTGPAATASRTGPRGSVQRRQLEAFILAFPTNLAPAVGQQITLRASSSAAVSSRINLLRQRAEAGECELVAKTRIFDDEAGFLYVGSGLFARDRRGQPPITAAALRSLATGSGRARDVHLRAARLRSARRRGPRWGRRLGRRRAARSYRSGGSGQQALIRARSYKLALHRPKGERSMKKSLKKLALHRETLRALEESAIQVVAGGVSARTCGSPCSATCTVTPCVEPSNACSFSPHCTK